MTKQDNVNYMILIGMLLLGFGVIISQWILQGVIVFSQ